MARPDKLPKILNEAETSSLLDQPNQRYFGPCRDYLYMRLMLKAGLRASEATALRPEHIDLMSGKHITRAGVLLPECCLSNSDPFQNSDSFPYTADGVSASGSMPISSSSASVLMPSLTSISSNVRPFVSGMTSHTNSSCRHIMPAKKAKI